MTTLPDGISQAEIDRYAKLDVALKKAKAEHDRLNSKIKRAFGVGVFVCDGVILTRTEADEFHKKDAETKYPYASNPDYYDLVPVLVKDRMPEAQRLEFEGKQQRLSVAMVTT